MHAHYLQHVPFEGLGSIEKWLLQSNYSISCTRFYQGDQLPSVEEMDMLIIMGGPMSVKDEQDFPWLKKEKQFIKEAIQQGKTVLGICLGAQLIAHAMGGEVFLNQEKEIGWFPVKAVESDKKMFFSFPPETEVFHWHGETFSLPGHAVLIAENGVCRNQAFQISSHVMGLQFHLETTPESLQAIVANCRNELTGATYIQTEKELLSTSPEKFKKVNLLMEEVLNWLQSCSIPKG